MADHKATLQRMFDEVINKGDLDVADELFAEDFIDNGPMGTMEGAAVLRSLLERTEGLELAGDPVRGTNPNLRGVLTLPLTLVAR